MVIFAMGQTVYADAEPEDGVNPPAAGQSAEEDPAADPEMDVPAGDAENQQSEDEQDEPAPAESITVVPYTGVYDQMPHSISFEGVPADAIAEYRTSEAEEWSSELPMRTDAGTTEVFYRITMPDGAVMEGSAAVTIEKAPLKSAALQTTVYGYYNNVLRHPKADVYADGISAPLREGSDYTLTYAAGCRQVGRYTVTITGTGNYTGSITKTFQINPGRTSLATRNLRYGIMTLKTPYAAKTYGATYFQFAYRTAGGAWKYAYTSTKSNSATFSAPNGTYYVKVRPVKKIGNVPYCGAWSSEYKIVSTKVASVERVLNASRRTGFSGYGYCARWVCNVFDRSGVLRSARLPYASSYYLRYCKSSNRADLRPGMIVASRYSYSGGNAGHIGIYIGNGRVISNTDHIEIHTIDQFARLYGHGVPLKWGWMNGKKLL